MKYEKRYCAYVDILGFADIVKTLTDETKLKWLHEALRFVHRPPYADLRPIANKSDLKFQSISDAVCGSAACNAGGLLYLFGGLRFTAQKLLEKGIFVRGAIVKGKLFHDDKVVFGEALVKAYQLESTVARYPRILLTKEVADEAQAYRKKHAKDYSDYVRQADDGPYYLHVLEDVESTLEDTNAQNADYRAHQIEDYEHIARMIQRRFNESVDDPRHFEKVQWFARYWNESTRGFRGQVPAVIGPGMNTFD